MMENIKEQNGSNVINHGVVQFTIFIPKSNKNSKWHTCFHARLFGLVLSDPFSFQCKVKFGIGSHGYGMRAVV